MLKTNIFVDFTSNNLWDLKKSLKENKTKPIPEDIFDKIIQCSLKEKNILTKVWIIIQSQTGLRAKEIKNKLDKQFKGKTEQEIDDIVSNLSKSMSFNPLPTGVCLYDFRMGNCSDGDGCFFYNCPNYVTEVKFYPVLKQELDLMEKEMARYKELGQQRSWERQYVKV